MSLDDIQKALGEHLRYVLAAGAVVLSLLVGLVLRRVLLPTLTRIAQKTAWTGDDIFIATLRRPLPWWCLFCGLYVASRIAQPSVELASSFDKVLLSAVILSATLWVSSLVTQLLQHRAVKGGAPGGSSSTGVVRYVVRALVLVVGGLVLLGTLGISVTPILTTFGIGGIAIALGLQETLGNLFAGMQVTLAGNLRVGDFIRLESGEEGYIEDIHWRATRIRTIPNNVVLIPNSKLAQSVVTNYHLPSTDLAIMVDLGVHYDSDLERVERVTVEVARTVMSTTPGGVPEFAPFLRYRAFAESSIDFTITLRAKSFPEGIVVRHELIKALTRRYAQEKIIIPFPIRAINLSQEQAPPVAPPAVEQRGAG